MPPSSPRDSFAFPLAAALWAVGGSLAASVVNVAMTLGRFMGEDALPDVLGDLLPGLLGSGLLSAALLAVLVFVVATHRQARAPDRVGHARGAAPATGLLAAFGTWAVVSLVSALAYGQIPALQSPMGFAVIGFALSIIHVAAAALGASLGAALLLQPGDAPIRASASRDAWAAAAIFGAVVAFGIDLVFGVLPVLLHDALGAGVFAAGAWSPVLALVIGATVALGYAWRRRRATTPLAWSGDAWAGLAVLPILLVLGALGVVLSAGIAYLLADGDLPALIATGIVVMLLAGTGIVGLGAVAGMVRLRRAVRRD